MCDPYPERAINNHIIRKEYIMEQNTTAVTSPAEEDVRTAIEDIAIIRRVIDRSEINLRRLGWLFLSYGAITFTLFMLKSILLVILSRMLSIEAVTTAIYIMQGLSFAVSVCLFVFFVNMRKEMIRTESKYTMKLYDLWGVMLFVPVVLGLAPVIISLIGSFYGASENTSLIYMFVFNIMRYAAVCMCVFFTGHYIGSMFMKIISLPMFILLPVICAFGAPFLDGYSLSTITGLPELYAYLTSKITFVSIILLLIYIVMGIVFLIKQRRNTDGNA